MNRSRLLKERNENSDENSRDSCDEGNCARTRPLSFDEIMLRRKKKHMNEDMGAAIGLKAIQRNDIIETVCDLSKSDLGQRHDNDGSSCVDNKESDHYNKSQSRRKEEKADVKKHTTQERGGYNQELDIKPKEKLSKELDSKLCIDKTGKEGHGRRGDSEAKVEKGHPREYSSSDSKLGFDKTGKEGRGRIGDMETKHEKGHPRDSKSIDKHRERSREWFLQDVHEEKKREKSAKVRYEGRGKEKPGNDRYEERSREKSGNDRHGERNLKRSGIDRLGERNFEKFGNDRHEERSRQKSGNDIFGERNIDKSGNDRHGERNIEKSGSDRREERNIEKSGNDRREERNIEISGTDKYEERSRHKSGNDKYEEKRGEKPRDDRHEERKKERHDITGEQIRGKSDIDKYDKRGREKTGNDKYEERSRGRVGNDRYLERTRDLYERKNTRKHRLGDDEKYEDKSSTKKHDPGRISEIKEKRVSYKHYNEDSKLKRRRSRSREHDVEKNRGSLSPRTRKRTLCPEREHGESSNSLKDRPGRQHSDNDRNYTSSNGLKGHYDRHSGSASGLGGYSPRKRKSDAAAKTPSPTNHSPDNKRDGWGLPSGGISNMNYGSVTSNFQPSNQTVSSNMPDPASVVPVALNTMRSLFGAPSDGFSSKITASVDSVQLTEATRPQRRLYVENIPDSVTEKALMEFINNSMLSSCIYHIQGSQPCISCIINKQKGQALAEFLTPEDASAALSFDGSSLAGSILKVRRPKDFIELATGELRKSAVTVNRQKLLDPVDVQKSVDVDDSQKTVPIVDTTSDFVKDSPYKIFIGGISEAFSSEMVMEIASAFGPVRSYCEYNAGLSYAILEYVDHSITPKACAGLNGMKLGGQVLTVVEVAPSMSSLGTTGNSMHCEIPEHARPLLEKPTHVIKLKNVITREYLTTLPESELEEVLEDVRIECARFGSVKSVNIVKDNSNNAADSCETNGPNGFLFSGMKSGSDKNNAIDVLEEATDHETPEISKNGFENNPDDLTKDSPCQSHVIDGDNHVRMQQLGCRKMSLEDSADFSNRINPSNEPSHCQDDEKAPENPLRDEKTCRDYGECQDEKMEDIQTEHIDMEASENLSKCHGENLSKCHDKTTSKDHSETPDKKIAQDVHSGDSAMDITAKDEENFENSPRALTRDDSKGEQLDLTGDQASREALASDDNERKFKSKEQDRDLNHIFELGSIFVEYKRTEASCMAAHCLHGRSFDGQPVIVEYVPLDLYQARFSK